MDHDLVRLETRDRSLFYGLGQQYKMNILARLKHVENGRRILMEWFGEGGIPVPSGQSAQRATICLSCPMNSRKPEDWLGQVTAYVARKIVDHQKARHAMALHTPHDAQLGTCTACDCRLQLKVHTPLPHIIRHLSSEDRDKLDAGCWILSESSKPNE